MKRLKLLTLLCLAGMLSAKAQTNDSIPNIAFDGSPLDLAYCPPNSPMDRSGAIHPLARVLYSRPQKKNRELFGNLIPFGQIWRLGANESTEITFYTDVNINDRRIPAGSYSLFVIPDNDKWTIIINKQTNKWGAFFYDKKLDIARIELPTQTTTNEVETLTIFFKEDKPSLYKMIIAWDKTKIEAPIALVVP